MMILTENAPRQKYVTLENSDSSVQIRIEPKIYWEFVLQDTTKCEFSVLLDFGGIEFWVDTIANRLSGQKPSEKAALQ